MNERHLRFGAGVAALVAALSARTSLITDPPDGRLPPLTPGGLKRRAASEAALNGVPSGPEDRLLQERCITYGSPSLVAGYAPSRRRSCPRTVRWCAVIPAQGLDAASHRGRAA